jgi:UDP-N-acetylglucosamine:LPS N-acetylglucosamine transferase
MALLPNLNGRLLLVRGKPDSTHEIESPANCEIVNHLSTAQMQQAFLQTEFVISRSGYTTVMEVLAMQLKSILIPTPGQTEQEYLAENLFTQHWCYSCGQNSDLLYHLNAAKSFNYNLPPVQRGMLEASILEILQKP